MNPKSVIERIFQLKALKPNTYNDKHQESKVNINIEISESALQTLKQREQQFKIQQEKDKILNAVDINNTSSKA